MAGEGISNLLDALGTGGPLARERAEELVREVTELYGEGLSRIVTIVSEPQPDGGLGALLADDLVSSLLLVHGLHPQDAPTRIAHALDGVRPYLGSHGGDVELLDVSAEGIVRLRLLGSCHGCPSSSVTLKLAVEGAIESAAPEVTSIVVDEEAEHAAAPAFIPLDSLRVRLDNVPEDSGSSWEPLPEVADLQPGQVAGFVLAEMPVLACRTNSDVFVFRDHCPVCESSMAGAVLQRALAAPTDGGMLRCPTCRKHFDVRMAGACIEIKQLHLDPLPLLVRSGVISVAVPTLATPVG